MPVLGTHNTTVVNLRFDNRVLEQFDTLAEVNDVTRSAIIRLCAMTGLRKIKGRKNFDWTKEISLSEVLTKLVGE